MPEDEWTLVARAASIIFDGERRIQRAWRDPSFPFRGVPHDIPRTREPIEIPSAERARLVLDCRRARAGRPRLWDYHSVEMRTADSERLAQEARTPTPQAPHPATTVGAVAAATGAAPASANTPVSEAPSEQPPQSVASVAETLAPKASRLVRKVAAALLKEYPEGRPDKDVEWMLQDLRSKYPKTKIGRGKRTLERAIQYLKKQGQPGW
jgi:hypothetical protein